MRCGCEHGNPEEEDEEEAGNRRVNAKFACHDGGILYGWQPNGGTLGYPPPDLPGGGSVPSPSPRPSAARRFACADCSSRFSQLSSYYRLRKRRPPPPTPPAGGPPAVERAKNVILFIGDAGGLPTLNAASLYGYDRPQALFIQKMPYIALMDTSTASNWVTDSAAGMTAIVTGRKTQNGVLSQSDAAVRGKKDGEPLKTILEYAEARGLSTGVITNDAVTGATPAACYAHANNRSDTAGIAAQLGKPLAGNGVDLVLGSGRSAIYKATAAAGLDLDAMLRGQGYTLLDSPEALRPDTPRAVGLTDASDYDLSAVVAGAIGALARNPKGYFLMVEWDLHTDETEERPRPHAGHRPGHPRDRGESRTAHAGDLRRRSLLRHPPARRREGPAAAS